MEMQVLLEILRHVALDSFDLVEEIERIPL